MYNPLILRVAQDRIHDELIKAESFRRTKAASQPQSSWRRRVGLAVSEVLIATGEKLRERYDPGSCYETL
jgi:hypothetical protein